MNDPAPFIRGRTDGPLSKPVAALTGLLGLAAALGAGHFVAAFVGVGASPFLAVGNSAVDLTPTWLKDWAASTFGTADKAVLLAGMAVVLVLVAIGAGLASRRSPLPGSAVIVVFGLTGCAAVFTRPDLGQLALLAPVVSLLAGLLVFRKAHALASRAEPTPAEGRRRFLLGAGGFAVAAGSLGLVGQLVGGSRDAARSRAAIGRLTPATKAPPIPAGADFAKLGTPSFITPNADFYRIDTALVVPQVTAEEWRLRVHGMVGREISLGYQDILDRPLVERTITMCCVSNEVGGPYISTANFIGIDLAELLTEAGVRRGAEQLFSTSSDGWTCGTPVEDVLDPARGALLAIGMNGEPLPLEHGFPARLVVPGLYGYVSGTKWVTDLELTTWAARTAYWFERGWGTRGPVKTQSRIDSPAGFGTVTTKGGAFVAAGIAWAQFTGIAKVEVSLDDGPWTEAELSTVVNDDSWRMWQVKLEVPRSGSHRLACRATDKSGYTQTARRAGVLPDGATGWHTVEFTTV
ncbi:DMSO/TMAO reductase YedYZ, molybdopterin-dependent catalytic subunit [Prauserella marina]|uniref:DMSO/TMAO reductase YedYZ, molybdopterin-dependent catalytic subunit n=1 Tax=Prauserella marina TaxID=530584 RepID=A0A1G6NWG3_9PSEU|nr:molybdopterin-dependent oxidoreductase [Prauserella marina]PWV82572.1 DMSO/TMAO reductase YedYZ molybdopterin-dependent catalytic subunit [Prauserella marina]SDC72272.1 DMSO/TMAO reductase YedYZ, molybdopterin-dependent catalytic subunit [Prauserella marina]